MSYVSYIIDHYDHLLLFTVFSHGHERGWHQVEPVISLLRAINLTAVAEDGFVNLRCNDHRNCNASDPNANRDLSRGVEGIAITKQKPLVSFWKLIFPSGPDPPSSLMTVGYGQFAVPRERLLAHPLSFWQGLRKILEKDTSEWHDKMPELKEAGEAANNEGLGGERWVMGLLFEQIWHVLMGAPAAYCPGEERCQKTWFADAVHCERVIEKPWEAAGWEDIKCDNDEERMSQVAEIQREAVAAARLSTESQPFWQDISQRWRPS